MAVNSGISTVGRGIFLLLWIIQIIVYKPCGTSGVPFLCRHPERAPIPARSIMSVEGGSPWERWVTVESGVWSVGIVFPCP